MPIYPELTPEQASYQLDLDQVIKNIKSKHEPDDTIFGQNQAMRAIYVGTSMKSQGYNVYVSGPAGSGRSSTVRKILRELTINSTPKLKDLCYVYNFKDPDQPILVTFPKGKAKEFEKDMEKFLATCLSIIPGIFNSESFIQKRIALSRSFQSKEKKQFGDFEKKIMEKGFALVETKVQNISIPDIYLIIEDQAISWDDYTRLHEMGQLQDEHFSEKKKAYEGFRKELDSLFNMSRALAREMNTKLDSFDKEWVKSEIDELVEKLTLKYKNYPLIQEHLKHIHDSVINNYTRFMDKEGGRFSDLEKVFDVNRKNFFNRYRVNVVLDNSGMNECPVVFEPQPTFQNLFGTIERTNDKFGTWYTDFTRIKAGSILKAHQGYLVVNAFDLLQEPGVWKHFTRILKTNQLELQNYEVFNHIFNPIIKPCPIDLDLKVILIGDEEIYSLLYHYDVDFKKIFKIKAQFDTEMNLSNDTIKSYVQFIHSICERESLHSVDKSGIQRIVEYGVRLAGRKDKLSTIFSQIANLLREAHFLSVEAKANRITGKHVDGAIDERQQRHNMYEMKMLEFTEKNVIFISTTGKQIGQINGLTVYDMGDYSFGRAVRITATTSCGKNEIINIEREANMSGNAHDKGVLILSGFLKQKFGQEFTLSVSASLCFEQSYSYVDGDSASSTEMYAILSSLAEVPIKQNLAVTGSVNQFGDIQAIGGVNEKIEGFFDLCVSKGLDGTQGVLIPQANVEDLVLKRVVIDAIADKKFHVYPVERIEQGIEILTDVPAGEMNENHEYPEDSIYGKVYTKLRIYNDRLENSKDDDDDNGQSDHHSHHDEDSDDD